MAGSVNSEQIKSIAKNAATFETSVQDYEITYIPVLNYPIPNKNTINVRYDSYKYLIAKFLMPIADSIIHSNVKFTPNSKTFKNFLEQFANKLDTIYKNTELDSDGKLAIETRLTKIFDLVELLAPIYLSKEELNLILADEKYQHCFRQEARNKYQTLNYNQEQLLKQAQATYNDKNLAIVPSYQELQTVKDRIIKKNDNVSTLIAGTIIPAIKDDPLTAALQKSANQYAKFIRSSTTKEKYKTSLNMNTIANGIIGLISGLALSFIIIKTFSLNNHRRTRHLCEFMVPAITTILAAGLTHKRNRETLKNASIVKDKVKHYSKLRYSDKRIQTEIRALTSLYKSGADQGLAI